MTYVPFSGAYTAVLSAPMSSCPPVGPLVSLSGSLVTLARLVPVLAVNRTGGARSVALFTNRGSTSTVRQNPAERPWQGVQVRRSTVPVNQSSPPPALKLGHQ